MSRKVKAQTIANIAWNVLGVSAFAAVGLLMGYIFAMMAMGVN